MSTPAPAPAPDQPSPLPPLIVEEAVRQAVAGDGVNAGMLLAPLVMEGRHSCYVLAGMLAEVASLIARRDQEPGTMFSFQIDNIETGEPGKPEDLPPDIKFAAQFTTAWANRDQDTAQALFDALADQAHTEAGAELLIDGVLALFQLAVMTAKDLVDEQRSSPGRED